MSLPFAQPARILAAAALVAGSFLLPSQVIAQSVTLTGSPSNFSDERPDYLHLKEAILTRKSKTSYNVDVTLAAPLPNNIKEDVVYFYVGFDIDNNANTGRTTASNPDFGQDIGAYVRKRFGTNRFVPDDGTAKIDGKSEAVKVTNLKMTGDKVSFDLRSSLFGDHDTFKFFVCSRATKFKNGEEISSIQVDTLSSRGPTTFGRDN